MPSLGPMASINGDTAREESHFPCWCQLQAGHRVPRLWPGSRAVGSRPRFPPRQALVPTRILRERGHLQRPSPELSHCPLGHHTEPPHQTHGFNGDPWGMAPTCQPKWPPPEATAVCCQPPALPGQPRPHHSPGAGTATSEGRPVGTSLSMREASGHRPGCHPWWTHTRSQAASQVSQSKHRGPPEPCGQREAARLMPSPPALTAPTQQAPGGPPGDRCLLPPHGLLGSQCRLGPDPHSLAPMPLALPTWPCPAGPGPAPERTQETGQEEGRENGREWEPGPLLPTEAQRSGPGFGLTDLRSTPTLPVLTLRALVPLKGTVSSAFLGCGGEEGWGTLTAGKQGLQPPGEETEVWQGKGATTCTPAGTPSATLPAHPAAKW